MSFSSCLRFLISLKNSRQQFKVSVWFGSWQCCLHHMHFSQPCADGLHSPSRTRATRLPCALMNNALMNLIVQPVLYNLQIQAYYVTHCTYCNKRWPGIVTVRVQYKTVLLNTKEEMLSIVGNHTVDGSHWFPQYGRITMQVNGYQQLFDTSTCFWLFASSFALTLISAQDEQTSHLKCSILGSFSMVSSTSALRLGCKILFWPQSCVSDLAEVDFKIVWSIEYHLVSRIMCWVQRARSRASWVSWLGHMWLLSHW